VHISVNSWRWRLGGSLVALLLILGTLVTGCSNQNQAQITVTQTTTQTTKALTEFETVQQAALSYFGSSKSLVTNSDALWKLINDGDTSNDPIIVDIRAATDYANGHIPGAINIPLADIFKPENLAKLTKDKQIVTSCYTGNTAQIAAAYLSLMGYNAISLRYSMMAWTKDATIQDPAKYNWNPDKSNDFAVVTQVFTSTAKNTFPTLATGGATASEIIRLASEQAYTRVKTHTVSSADLFKNLNDGDNSNDPVIIDIRKAADYAAGHINGAVNIVAADVFKTENLEKLPTDKQIIINCYTGQTSQLVATALRSLGYNAASLKFGIMDWSKNDTLLGAAKRWSADTEQWGYPIEK